MDNPNIKNLDQILSPAIRTDDIFGKTHEKFPLRSRLYPASIFTVLVGFLAIIGWVFDISLFRGITPGLATMKVNTAVCFILSGISLFLLQTEPHKSRNILIGRVLGLVVLAVGLLTLCQYLFGWDLRIDQLLFNDEISSKSSVPGRMSPITAVNFVLTGGSLLFLIKKSHIVNRPAQWAAVVVALISILSIIGYAYDVQSLYEINLFRSVALHTALSFLVLSAGVIFTQPRRSIASMIFEENTGGVLLRTLLPAALISPFVLGWLRLKGQQAGYYSTEFGLALFASSNIVIFVALTVILAKFLGNADEKRKLAVSALLEKDAQLNDADRHFADIFYGMTEAFFVLDFDWCFKFVNDRSEAFLDRTREEMLGKPIWEVFGHLVGTAVEAKYRRVMDERIPDSFEVFSTHLERWLDVRLFPTSHGLAAFLLDIHDRKLLDAERQKFVSLAENSSEFIGMSDLQGKPSFINEAGWRLVGLDSLEAALQKKIEDFFFPEDRAFILNEFLPKIKLVGQDETEIRFCNFKGGEAIWVLCNGFLLRDEKGEAVGFATVSRDITARKRADQQLRESTRRMQIATEATAVGIWEWNVITNQVHWDAQMFRIYGIPPTKYGFVDFSTWSAAVHPDDLSRQVEILQDTIARKGQGRREFRIRRPDEKEYRFIQAVETIRMNDKGEAEWVLGTNLDCTEQRRTERMISEMNETLERRVSERTLELHAVNRELEAFSYSVSHDLRAPLRAMDGFSLALLEDYYDKLDDDGKDFLVRVRAGSRKMARLIDDLLKLSQLSRGQLHRENINLSNIVREITDRLQESEPKFRVNLKIESDVWANVDDRLIRAGLENLLNNAWKFTSKKENAEISFGQNTENGETIYFVRDNGAGFDMTYADKLFGAFQRLHNSKEFEGTGIGLATVQRIINRHGGQIWAQSVVESGTTFFFKLGK